VKLEMKAFFISGLEEPDVKNFTWTSASIKLLLDLRMKNADKCL